MKSNCAQVNGPNGGPRAVTAGASPVQTSMDLGRILIIDDNQDLLLAMRMFLKHHAERVDLESDPTRIPELLGRERYHLLLLDMNFTRDTTSGREGFFWLQRILEIDPAAVVVMITGYGDVETAVEAVKSGATDFVLKPFKNEKLLEICRRAVCQGRPFRRDAQQKEFLESEMATAHQVQDRLFPQAPPLLYGLDCAAACRTARETGGDYYDFLSLSPQTLGIAMADVSGKGVSAALLMANLQGRLQSFAPLRAGALDQLMLDLNQSMCRVTESSRYATFFYGVWEESRKTLTYVNAGHHAPMLFRAETDGEPERLAAGGTVIGLFPEALYEQATVRLRAGDVLVLFTDGLVEAPNSAGEEFGEDRIALLARDNRLRPAGEIRDQILQAAEEFSQGASPSDDLTLVVAKVR